MAFRWISMFSGAGCGDLGLHRAGHEIVAGIENEKQPAGVFAYNFPDVPLFCDIKKVDADDLPDADGVIYSFPCQDLSYAGKRKGLDGDRSTLYEESIRIISKLKERGLILSLAENVAGLMSSGDKNDFARLVKDLSEVGHNQIGWTHLDSQHVGFSFPQDRGSDKRGVRRAVPQRRMRVFVLGTLCDIGNEAIEEIFSFKHRVSGHLTEGRKTRKAGTTSTNVEKGTRVICNPVASALQTTCFDYSRTDNFTMIAEGPCYENHGQDSRIKDCGDLSPTITKKAGTGGNNLPIVAGCNVYAGVVTGDVTPTITTATGISNGTGAKVCYALAGKSIGRNQKSDTNGLGVSDEDIQYTLTIGDKHAVAHDLTVRRITPLEAERLQGLTDDFTKYREDLELVDNRWVKKGKVIEVKDGPRYRMLGNGITAHVMEWIARRISLVTGL